MNILNVFYFAARPNMPYVLPRSKNGMLPVYLKITNRMRRTTHIKHVHGDLWQMAEDVKKYLEEVKERDICVKIHEICGQLIVHGDHVSDVKVWALKQGF